MADLENLDPTLKADSKAVIVPVDHVAGQIKAELFEELVYRLAEKVFPEAKLTRNFVIRRVNTSGHESPTSVDLVVEYPASEFVVIECKVPYTSTPSHGINRAIRHLKDIIPRLQRMHKISRAVVAIGAQIPASSVKEIEQAKKFFQTKKVEFEVWDSVKIHSLTIRHLHSRIPEFSVENLQRLLSREVVKVVKKKVALPAPQGIQKVVEDEGLAPGLHSKVIVLCADFCSYSKFVHVSRDSWDLVISIMGRFYRETRAAITSKGGKVDKFMGDGVLAFWPINEMSDYVWRRIDGCLSDLVGISLNLAKEWQDQVDIAVDPIGLRAGAAVGDILMVEEMPEKRAQVHAIGECINMAARLQGEAEPNTLLVSNKLKTLLSSEGGDVFKKLPPKKLKNIGETIVWERAYGNGD